MLEYELMVLWLAGEFDAALAQGQESLAWNAAGMSRRRAFGLAFAALAARRDRPAGGGRTVPCRWPGPPRRPARRPEFRRYAQAVLDHA